MEKFLRRVSALFRAVATLAPIPLAIILASQSVAGAVGTCSNDVNHWYAQAVAPVGAGTSDGSNIAEAMPSSYYAGPNVTNDEATWVLNWTWITNNSPPTNNYTHDGGFELGWFQGEWPYSTSYSFYHAPHAYMTTYNGTYGSILNSSDLPQNGDVVVFKLGWVDTLCNGNSVYDSQTATYYYQTSTCYTNSSIEVPTPRDNFSQGEIRSSVANNNESTWMGGNSGSGLTSFAQYQAISNHLYYNWGSYLACDNTPYWITGNTSTNVWTNGGS